ncbi:hypothetical protein ACVXZ0_16760 [Staphylococcus aureus]
MQEDHTVRQSEQKPQVGDLSKHIDGQNSPEKPTDKNTDNKQLIKDALQAPKTRSTTNAAADAKKVRPLKRIKYNHLTNIQLFLYMDF